MRRKWINTILIIVFTLVLSGQTAFAAYPYTGYENVYDTTKGYDTVKAPTAYEPLTVLKELGLSKPEDIFAKGDLLYIMDSGNGRVIVLDAEFTVQKEFKGFSNKGVDDNFLGATGLYVDEKQNIFIADKKNARIVQLDKEGRLIRIVGSPTGIEKINENFRFMPVKLAVDRTGRIYTLSEGTFDGLILIENDGSFGGFLGANKVQTNFWDSLWKKVLTKEQVSVRTLYVPVELSNMDIDAENFIFATAKGNDRNQMIRKFNLKGTDVLKTNENSFFGDISSSIYQATNNSPSYFIDVSVNSQGLYSCLDSARGRIFTYDHDANLLFVFGGLSSRAGGFSNPIALTWFNDRIIVLDYGNDSLTVFAKTDYADKLMSAIRLYRAGDYEKSYAMWEDVLKLNSNSKIAYIGVGKSYLRDNNYVKAMEYFVLGDNSLLYSKAFESYRREMLTKWMPYIFILIGLVALILIVYFTTKSLRKLSLRLRQGRETRMAKGGVVK